MQFPNKNYYRLSTQRIVSKIENDLNFLINQCNKISLDQKLYEMLDKNYRTELEYVEAYFDYFQPFVYFNGETYQQVSNMLIYTDNPTILNSGDVRKINEQVRNEEWYQEVINSPDKVYIIYGKTMRKSDNTVVTPLSVIQVLKEFQGLDRSLKIVRIDYKVENIINVINAEKMRGNVLIFDNNNKILFSDRYPDFGELENLLSNDSDHIICIVSEKSRFFRKLFCSI